MYLVLRLCKELHREIARVEALQPFDDAAPLQAPASGPHTRPRASAAALCWKHRAVEGGGSRPQDARHEALVDIHARLSGHMCTDTLPPAPPCSNAHRIVPQKHWEGTEGTWMCSSP